MTLIGTFEMDLQGFTDNILQNSGI